MLEWSRKGFHLLNNWKDNMPIPPPPSLPPPPTGAYLVPCKGTAISVIEGKITWRNHVEDIMIIHKTTSRLTQRDIKHSYILKRDKY